MFTLGFLLVSLLASFQQYVRCLTFEGQFADLLFGHIQQSAVQSRAQRVIQFIDASRVVISGTDDGVTWWGDIMGNVTNNGLKMFVDFSPKGGPSSVEANLAPSGHILWTGNNAWERTSKYASFAGTFSNTFSGMKPPSFPTQFQSVQITLAPFTAPNYHTTKAIISVGSGVAVSGIIQYNVLSANFDALGGSSSVIGNLTSSGDIVWPQSENLWARSLCDSTSSSSSSQSLEVFTQNKTLSIISFTSMLFLIFSCLFIGVGYTFKRKKNYGDMKFSVNLLSS